MANRLYLVKQGVPFDLAFSLDDDTAKGFTVLFGNIETGGRQSYNWELNRWENNE